MSREAAVIGENFMLPEIFGERFRVVSAAVGDANG